MDREELAFAGVRRQRELLADGSLRARDLMSLCLDRIATLNPRLNAFTLLRPADALREADEAQQALDRGDRRPLLGIPFAVKDEQDLAGSVTSYGTAATSVVAEQDAEMVRRLRLAGAIPVGKTTLPELGMHPFTESITWGATRNPWDLSRTPGGSSGGSAAAVAAGLVPLATAGDGGGSIRIPASCCHLFGLKVQRGRVPTAEAPGGLSVSGVLTRRVADAALVYDVLAPEAGLVGAADEAPAPLRIGLTFRLGGPARVADDVRARVNGVADVLRAVGHEVRPLKVDPGNWLPPFSIIGLRTLVEGGRVVDAPERLEARTRTGLRTGTYVTERMLRWALVRQEQLTTRSARVFDDVDLILTPTMALPPAPVGVWSGKGLLRTSLGLARYFPFTALWNFFGHPAANVPAGFTASGLPVGAQLLAPADGEPTLVAVAAQLERELRWPDHRPPAVSGVGLGQVVDERDHA